MSNNITSTKIIAELDKVIQDYIVLTKQQNMQPTRDTMIEIVTSRLEKMVELSPENKERTWIISGVAVGIAMVLHIEEKLKMNE